MTEWEESHCLTCVTLLSLFPSLKTTPGVSLLGTEGSSATGDVRRAEASAMTGEPRTRSLVMQDSTDHRNAKVFRAHAAPQGMCDNLISALKLLANHQ